MNKETTWLLQEKYRGVPSPEFMADCTRLAQGEPLAYVIGYVPFLDCQIWLDSRPLIPRPETEFWVQQFITTIQAFTHTIPQPLRILDLCAGSGAIGIAIGNAVPDADITFAELDPQHLPTIEKNLTTNGLDITSGRYHLITSDLFTTVDGPFDFIVTNPPYIDRDAHTVDPAVERYEPPLALFGGTRGTAVIEQIIAGAQAMLVPPTNIPTSQQLWIEHEPFQTETIQQLATKHNFAATTHEDQYHTPRFSVLSVAQ